MSQFIMLCESLHFFLCVDSEKTVLMESSEILWQDILKIYATIRIFSLQDETGSSYCDSLLKVQVENVTQYKSQ